MMSKTQTALGVAALVAVIAVIVVYSMRVSSSDCQAACARPFELSAATSGTQRSAWEGFPEPNRAQALAVHDRYAEALESAKQTYLETCVSDCTRGSNARQVACYTRAQNLADWKRCAAP